MKVKAMGQKTASSIAHNSKTKNECAKNNKVDYQLIKLISLQCRDYEIAKENESYQINHTLEKKFTQLSKELSEAVQNNDREALELLIHKAYENEMEIDSIFETVLAQFASKDIERYKILKKISQIALLKISILKQDPTLLRTEFSEKIQLPDVTKKSLIYTINSMLTENPNSDKKSYLMRLKAEIEAIYQIDFKRHNLTPLEILQVCLKVEKIFTSHVKTRGTTYLRRTHENIPRSVIVNFDTKIFTVLSKKDGFLQAHGSFKRVTDAIQVTRTFESATAKRMARAVNKFEKKINERELQFELIYGNIDTLISYPAKRDSSVTKTNILTEVYDHDLYVCTANTVENARKSLTINEIISILEQVGNELQRMHHDGIVHRDFKAKNVLMRRNPDDTIDAKICDFGHMNRPSNKMVTNQEYRTHGTLRYSGPELLEAYPESFNPFEQQKAIDMYGLGNMIYELVTQKKTSWGHDMYVALKEYGKKAGRSRKKALELQKEVYKNLSDENQPPHSSPKKELLWITAQLLNPDLTKRMNIDEFQTAINGLKRKMEKKS